MQMQSPVAPAFAAYASTAPSRSSGVQDRLLTLLDEYLPTDADASRSSRGMARTLGLWGTGLLVSGFVVGGLGIALDALSMPLIVVGMVLSTLGGFALLFALFALLASGVKGNDEQRARILAREYHGVHARRMELHRHGVVTESWGVVIYPRIAGSAQPIEMNLGPAAAGSESAAAELVALLEQYRTAA